MIDDKNETKKPAIMFGNIKPKSQQKTSTKIPKGNTKVFNGSALVRRSGRGR